MVEAPDVNMGLMVQHWCMLIVWVWPGWFHMHELAEAFAIGCDEVPALLQQVRVCRR